MSVRLLRASLLAGGLLVTLAAFAQTPRPQKAGDAIEVASTSAGHLNVQISEPSTLNKVFRAICTEQKLECTGAEGLASYNVPKMAVDGTLREVIDNLLGGSGVNYRYTRATAGVEPKLVLLGHAPQGTTSPPPISAKADDTAVNPIPLHSVRYRGRGNIDATETAPNSTPNEAQPQTSNGPTASNQSGLPPADQDRNFAAMEQMFGGASAKDVKPAEFLPFPDEFGNPIPVNHTPVTSLPFPDEFGNPIPVNPNQPSGSPFPTVNTAGSKN